MSLVIVGLVVVGVAVGAYLYLKSKKVVVVSAPVVVPVNDPVVLKDKEPKEPTQNGKPL
jgi:hypothetical protein